MWHTYEPTTECTIIGYIKVTVDHVDGRNQRLIEVDDLSVTIYERGIDLDITSSLTQKLKRAYEEELIEDFLLTNSDRTAQSENDDDFMEGA